MIAPLLGANAPEFGCLLHRALDQGLQLVRIGNREQIRRFVGQAPQAGMAVSD